MKRKILIVDDDLALSEEVKLTLEEVGEYEVLCENRGQEALITAAVFKPDLILLDIHIPDLSGLEVSAQLKQFLGTSSIPIVFFTVLVTREQLEAKSGIINGYPYLSKPSRIEEIVACIEHNIRRENAA